MTRFQPRSLAPLPMTTNHTLRPVIDELRAADPMDAPPGFPPIEPAADVVGLEPAGITRRVRAKPQALPIGMVEPPPQPPAEDEFAHLRGLPRPLLTRLLPSTATAFWMAVSAWLGFLLVRAEGWL